MKRLLYRLDRGVLTRVADGEIVLLIHSYQFCTIKIFRNETSGNDSNTTSSVPTTITSHTRISPHGQTTLRTSLSFIIIFFLYQSENLAKSNNIRLNKKVYLDVSS